MKCQICHKRKAAFIVSDEQFGKMNVCKKCKVEFYTGANDAEIERDAERRAEYDAMHRRNEIY